jgi:hypothetical protein
MNNRSHGDSGHRWFERVPQRRTALLGVAGERALEVGGDSCRRLAAQARDHLNNRHSLAIGNPVKGCLPTLQRS